MVEHHQAQAVSVEASVMGVAEAALAVEEAIASGAEEAEVVSAVIAEMEVDSEAMVLVVRQMAHRTDPTVHLPAQGAVDDLVGMGVEVDLMVVEEEVVRTVEVVQEGLVEVTDMMIELAGVAAIASLLVGGRGPAITTVTVQAMITQESVDLLKVRRKIHAKDVGISIAVVKKVRHIPISVSKICRVKGERSALSSTGAPSMTNPKEEGASQSQSKAEVARPRRQSNESPTTMIEPHQRQLSAGMMEGYQSCSNDTEATHLPFLSNSDVSHTVRSDSVKALTRREDTGLQTGAHIRKSAPTHAVTIQYDSTCGNWIFLG